MWIHATLHPGTKLQAQHFLLMLSFNLPRATITLEKTKAFSKIYLQVQILTAVRFRFAAQAIGRLLCNCTDLMPCTSLLSNRYNP